MKYLFTFLLLAPLALNAMDKKNNATAFKELAVTINLLASDIQVSDPIVRKDPKFSGDIITQTVNVTSYTDARKLKKFYTPTGVHVPYNSRNKQTTLSANGYIAEVRLPPMPLQDNLKKVVVHYALKKSTSFPLNLLNISTVLKFNTIHLPIMGEAHKIEHDDALLLIVAEWE